MQEGEKMIYEELKWADHMTGGIRYIDKSKEHICDELKSADLSIKFIAKVAIGSWIDGELILEDENKIYACNYYTISDNWAYPSEGSSFSNIKFCPYCGYRLGDEK